MKTKGVMLSMLLCAVCTAWADNDRDAEKIRLVEKIYREQGFMKYASPEFKRIVRKGRRLPIGTSRWGASCSSIIN